ncbi:MAG: hypothetical protein DHS20C01_18220 [marine bacterium B5-7]|nr:MAG: hypothetical protein DHS20C01_18220 [marine bacterium B5-7]
MFTRIVTATMISAALLVGGCATTNSPPVNKETAGTGIGAVAGALLGYGLGKGHSDKEAAVVIGAILGGAAGNRLGARLNEADRIMAGNTLGDALENDPVGNARQWQNPDTGHAGSAVPTRTFYNNDGTPCREFTTTVNIGGQQENAHGTACRVADGSWKIVQ